MKNISLRQVRYNWGIYVLLLPALLLIGTFAYYPAVKAMYHAFFRWNGDDIAEFVGLANFQRAFSDETLGYAFGIVLIFIIANFFKMIPSITTAVVVHRMSSERAKYLYRVLFVLPMVIPGIVWLLLWKFIYRPNDGVLNWVLTQTGGMWVLRKLDTIMPVIAEALSPAGPLLQKVYGPFGAFGMLIVGIMFLSAHRGHRAVRYGWLWWLLLLPGALFLLGTTHMIIVCVLILSYLVVHAQVTRADTAYALANPYDYSGKYANLRGLESGAKWIAIGLLVVAGLLILLTKTWTEPTKLFDQGRPPWLGHAKLALPAMIFWGFPWMNVVSVLLYLSGLGNIDDSVYEAADIDGCGWLRKFWNIELPLILNQVRLTLVLMIIFTLKGWGLVFIIYGDGGGPGGAVMLPGLYMFRKAFNDMEAGYACAIGLILFVLIVMLTLLNNKYVRVEK